LGTSLVSLFGQQPSISIQYQNVKLDKVLLDIAAKHKYDILFHDSYFSDCPPVNITLKDQDLETVLHLLLKDTKITFEVTDKQIALNRMRTIYGYVKSKKDHESLSSAAVYHPKMTRGTYTNEHGYFSLAIPFECEHIIVQNLGYQSQTIEIPIASSKPFTVYLMPFAELQEIIVRPNDKQIKYTRYDSSIDILPLEIGGHLSTGGEPDINQHLYKQSGVSSGPDGFGGLHVRGGNSDQNLILLDGVRIFQPNHAFGLFSIFNTPLLKNAKFSKFNFHPKHSGGISSVLEMNLKEGSTKEWNGNLSVSTLATQITVNGPLIKDKTSILLSFRRSHLDPFIKRISSKRKDNEGESNFHLYDFHIKLHHLATPKDKLYLSYYQGKDEFHDDSQRKEEINDGITQNYKSDYLLNWSNRTMALKWNHLFGDQLFSSSILSLSNFFYKSDARNQNIIVDQNENSFEATFNKLNFISKNQEIGFRYDLEHFPFERIRNSAGVSYNITSLIPGVINDMQMLSSNNPDTIPPSWLIEDYVTNSYRQHHVAIYANHKVDLSNQVTLNLGGRYGYVISKNLIDNRQSQFNLWNARISLAYVPNKKMLFRLSTSKNDQELHLLTSSNIGFPNDLWVPAIGNNKPQTAWQSNLYFHYDINTYLSLKTSIFYKKMRNLLRYPYDISLPSLDENISTFWEEELVSGTGTSRGWEIDINYKSPKITLDIAYTLSKYERQFEDIQGGNSFPFIFDQTHNLSVGGQYNIHTNFSFYYNFVFNNGIHQTLFGSEAEYSPIEVYSPDDREQLSSVNGDRLPAYHRLDLGFIIKFGKTYNHELVLGVQNIYNRKNIYYRYHLFPSGAVTNEFIEESIEALPILPIMRYSVRF